jgi:hypothetical protein
MYLLPAGAPTTHNKWGLGWPVAPRNRFAQRRSRSLGRIGDDDTPAEDYFLDTGINLTPTATTTDTALPGTLDSSSFTPLAPTSTLTLNQPNISNQQAYQNLLTTQQVDQSPLDYVSPQAAIAAGLPASTVNSAWSSQLATYPTQAAALAAGIAPAVVTALWAQSRSAVPATSTSLLSGNTLLYLGGGILLLAVLGGGKK